MAGQIKPCRPDHKLEPFSGARTSRPRLHLKSWPSAASRGRNARAPGKANPPTALAAGQLADTLPVNKEDSAMTRLFDIEPLDASFGAVVTGLTLADLDEASWRAL